MSEGPRRIIATPGMVRAMQALGVLSALTPAEQELVAKGLVELVPPPRWDDPGQRPVLPMHVFKPPLPVPGDVTPYRPRRVRPRDPRPWFR